MQVWPFHRLVCGERAHPFHPPPFSQDEVGLLLKRLAQASNGSRQASLQAGFLRILEESGLRGPDVRGKVRQLVGQDYGAACMHHALNEPRFGYLVRSISKLSSAWYT